MNFYADENFPLRTIKELRNLGHDVLTALEDNRANQAIPDDAFLSRAIELKRIVLTHNRIDFIRLHKQNPVHSGIIVCIENKDRKELAKLITQNVSQYNSLDGELIRIYRPSNP